MGNKNKQKLIFYMIAGGYVLYQGISIIYSLVKKGSGLSDNLMYYIFGAVFIVFGTVVLLYVLKSYIKQLNDLKNTQQIDDSDDSESAEWTDEKINDQKESSEDSEDPLK